MTPRVSRAATVITLVAFFGCAVGAVLLTTANEGVGRGGIWFMTSTAFFAISGAVITGRQPGNRIGWLFSAIGLVWASGAFAVEYSVYGIVTNPDSVPVPWVGAWYGEWNWIVFWFLALVTTPMMFPTGRALSARWKRALQVILIAAGSLLFLTLFDPMLEIEGTGRHIQSPLGTSFGVDPDDPGSVGVLLLPLMLAAGVVAGLSLVLRFRRSRGEERLQMKWFTFGAIMLTLGYVALAGVDAIFGFRADFLYGVVLTMVPVGAGIGILRYRLYDIDVVINRALVYGGLTAFLAGAYFGLVVLFQGALPGAGDSDLAVAASTLAVAALFRPARARVQAFIDRRFYRRKYDAARTLDEFSSSLRQELDLDQFRSQLVAVVRTTMQPVSVSLWLSADELSGSRGES